jgi:hypothetical protein
MLARMQLRKVTRINIMALMFAWLSVLFTAVYGYAECVSPIPNPSDNTPYDKWHDVLSAKMNPTSNSVSYNVQDIELYGTGNVNLDFYTLTFDSNGHPETWWATKFRENLNTYIYSETSYSVIPIDEANKAIWRSTAPFGAVLKFNLSKLAGIPLEQGAVVVSCNDSASFIFSTVSVPGTFNPGDHPVSGNRGFGFYQNTADSITFFTKGADRLKKDNAKFSVLGSQRIFKLGSNVWTGLLDRLATVTVDSHPRNRITYKRQVPYLANDVSPPSPPINLRIE